MQITRLLLFGLAALGLALFAVACGGGSLKPATPTPGATATVQAPQGNSTIGAATPALLEGASSDPSTALATLRKSSAAAGQHIDDLLASRIEPTLAALRHAAVPCEQIRTEAGTECDTRGIAVGTELERVALDPEGTYYADVGQVRDALAYILTNRSPALALLAQSSDGRVVAVLSVTPGLPFSLPGGIEEGSLRITRLQVSIAADGSLLGIGQVSDATPPLEVIRFDAHQNKVTFDILYASAEFRAAEKAFADKLEAASKTP